MREHPDTDRAARRRRLATTPMGDLLRGRITGRLDVDERLRGYSLPPQVVKHAKRIARRTRLSRSERADIAVELAETAALELEAGSTVEEVIASMGEPRALARRLRQERMLGHSLPRRMLRRGRGRVAMGLMVACCTYAFLVIRFHTGTPVLRRNIAREFSQPFAHVPEAERGVTLFRQAAALWVPVPEEITKWPQVEPGTAQWMLAMDHLAAVGPALERVRRAAEAPWFGKELSDAYDPTFGLTPAARAEPATPASINPPVLNLMLNHLGPMRQFARTLALDARAAALAGEAQRTADDLQAMLGLARHAREAPLLICDLVGVAIWALAEGTLSRILADHPDLFSDSQLQGLSRGFAEFAGGTFPLRLEGETAAFEDFLQRIFTDDGNGDGRLCFQGVANLLAMGDPPQEPTLGHHFISPLSSLAHVSRRELSDMWAHLMRLAEQDELVPRWQQDSFLLDDELDRIELDEALSRRYRLALIIPPAIAKARESMAQARQSHEGILTAIALVRYRMAHGAYPQRLQELVPEFLPAVGIDTFDGAPLRYRFDDRQPVLYALGTDLDDDGGRPTSSYMHAIRRLKAKSQFLAKDGDLILWPPHPEETEETAEDPDEESGSGEPEFDREPF